MTSRKSMCLNKVSFRTKEKAEEAAARWGQRVYECPVCFCWHCTSLENWKYEFIAQEECEKRMRTLECNLRREFNEKLRQKNSEITELTLMVKKLKRGEDE